MTKLSMHPRIIALLTLLGGAAITVAVIAIGGTDQSGRTGGKAIFLMGIAGIAAGVGLVQLLWPPRPAEEDDERSAWTRAPILQKMLWILGGSVGVVAAAVTQVVMTGKY